MFEMTQVTKTYRTDLLETHALREFSLTVDKGEFVAVTGPSGSGKTYPGEVSTISPEVRQGEVTGRVRLRELPPGLRQNQRVSVRILMDKRDNVLKVERGGFYEAGGGSSAYVVKDGVGERHPIKTGAVSVREIEILDGLAEGDQIVISDTEDFKNAPRVLLAD